MTLPRSPIDGRRATPSMKHGHKTADVILASTDSSKDLFYATRFSAPDPYAFFRVSGRKYLIASDLEIGRAREGARVHHVLPFSRYRKRLKKQGVERPSTADVLVSALRERSVERARVPADFPVLAADRLRDAGISVEPVAPPFFPERVLKSEDEIEAVREAARLTGRAMTKGIELIRRSKSRNGWLYLSGQKLTSERVRAEIETELLRTGMAARNTIVAGGEQAVDPHNAGSGPLRSGRPVVIDCFPASLETGLHADISRTVCRGRPGPQLVRMWDAVVAAQDLGIGMVEEGAVGAQIHRAIQRFYEDAGFSTGPTAQGKMQGYFHGTGHGLGLDVHEPPMYSALEAPLKAGMVITVEPGLYYPGLGGIRLEDDVVVRERGAENLTDLPREFRL